MASVVRCPWCEGSDLMREYHDHEWGVPLHDDRKLFEFMVLDAFQAGLSWAIVLKKRDGFRKAFDNFDYKKIARYTEEDIADLGNNPDIIRNKLKIAATVVNARAFIKIQEEFGSFDKYIWQFVNHKPVITKLKSQKEIRSSSPESDAMSKDLKKRGFKFVGTTICYAFMQAAGMINDHMLDCFRHTEV